MDLQSIFYVVGIIFMVMMIGLLLSLAYFLTRVQQSIQSMRQNITEKTQEIKEQANGKIAGVAGSLVTAFIMSRVKDMLKKKKES